MSEALPLMGHALAHACWILVHLGDDELLVPFIVAEQAGGSRTIWEFEAETQTDAVVEGKAFLADPPKEVVRLALVRDGLLRDTDGTASDVLSVTGRELGQPDLTISQRYCKAASGFHLLDVPFISSGEVDDEASALFLFRTGIDGHGEAGPLWAEWSKTRMKE